MAVTQGPGVLKDPKVLLCDFFEGFVWRLKSLHRKSLQAYRHRPPNHPNPYSVRNLNSLKIIGQSLRNLSSFGGTGKLLLNRLTHFTAPSWHLHCIVSISSQTTHPPKSLHCKEFKSVENCWTIPKFGIKMTRNLIAIQKIHSPVDRLERILTMAIHISPYSEPWTGLFSRDTCHVTSASAYTPRA